MGADFKHFFHRFLFSFHKTSCGRQTTRAGEGQKETKRPEAAKNKNRSTWLFFHFACFLSFLLSSLGLLWFVTGGRGSCVPISLGSIPPSAHAHVHHASTSRPIKSHTQKHTHGRGRPHSISTRFRSGPDQTLKPSARRHTCVHTLVRERERPYVRTPVRTRKQPQSSTTTHPKHKPPPRYLTLCASISAAHLSSPFATTHSSRACSCVFMCM